MSWYEIVVVYDSEYAEIIEFETKKLINDSSDIIDEAIRLSLLEDIYANKVR